MKFKLSEREINLIFLLSLLLIVFLYISFIRTDLTDTLDELNFEKSGQEDLISKFDISNTKNSSNIKRDIYLDEFNRFHKNDEFAIHLPINEENHHPIQKNNHRDTNIYEKEITYTFHGSLDDLLKILMENIKPRYLKELRIHRIESGNFEFMIGLSKYTLEEIPYTGIVKQYNYENEDLKSEEALDIEEAQVSDESSTDTSSLDSNIQVKEEKMEENNNSQNLEKTPNNPTINSRQNNPPISNKVREINNVGGARREKEIVKEEIKPSELEASTKEDPPIMTLSEEEKNFKKITKFLNDSSDSQIKNSLLDINYFLNNKNSLISSKEINKFIIEDGSLLYLAGTDSNICDLNLVFNNNYLYSLDYKTDGDEIVTLELITNNGIVFTEELKPNQTSWRTYLFNLPNDQIHYPINIIGIKTSSPIAFKNLIYYEI